MTDSKTVLIVDCSHDSRKMMQAIIVDAEPDWNVIEVESLEYLLSHDSEFHPDMITYDSGMSKAGDVDGAVELKNHFPKAHIALLSMPPQSDVKDVAINLGLDVIPKPVTEEKVKAFIH